MVSSQAEAGAGANANACIHHWKLDRPIGAATRGRCKNCGEERDFQQATKEGSHYTRGPRAK